METSISCNMTIPGKNARNCLYYGRKLIAEAAFSRSSGRQTRPCGLLMKGLRPLHTSRRHFADRLRLSHLRRLFSMGGGSYKSLFLLY